MKLTRLSLSLTVLLGGLILYASYGQSLASLTLPATGKGKEVMQDNEFERHSIGQSADIHCNPLLLNGKTLDYGRFTINSTGELVVVKGDPESPGSSAIPFYIMLRRDGKILDINKMGFLNKELFKIEISDVLAFGQPGDQLVIDPVNKEDWKAKRILKLVL